ncbi:MAG: nucleotidyltransferase family protein, partial [Calditrichaeota bacterium]
GDMGARGVVASSKPGVVEVPFEEVRPFQDVDSREGFAALSGKP